MSGGRLSGRGGAFVDTTVIDRCPSVSTLWDGWKAVAIGVDFKT